MLHRIRITRRMMAIVAILATTLTAAAFMTGVGPALIERADKGPSPIAITATQTAAQRIAGPRPKGYAGLELIGAFVLAAGVVVAAWSRLAPDAPVEGDAAT